MPMQVLVVHVQVLGLLVTSQVGWPAQVTSFFNVLRFPEASSVWMSPDCLLPKGASNTAFWRIAIITLSPSKSRHIINHSAMLCCVMFYSHSTGSSSKQIEDKLWDHFVAD
jgi:hypothetical protein